MNGCLYAFDTHQNWVTAKLMFIYLLNHSLPMCIDMHPEMRFWWAIIIYRRNNFLTKWPDSSGFWIHGLGFFFKRLSRYLEANMVFRSQCMLQSLSSFEEQENLYFPKNAIIFLLFVFNWCWLSDSYVDYVQCRLAISINSWLNYFH